MCQLCVLRLPGFGDRRGKAARTFLTSWAKSAESRGGSPSSGRVQESSAEPWATTRMTPAAEEGTARGPRRGGARLSLDPGSPKLLGRNYPTVPQTRLSPGAGSSCGWRRLIIAVPPPAACASAEPTAPAGVGPCRGLSCQLSSRTRWWLRPSSDPISLTIISLLIAVSLLMTRFG